MAKKELSGAVLLARLQRRNRDLELLADDFWWLAVLYRNEMSHGRTEPSDGLIRRGKVLEKRRDRLIGKHPVDKLLKEFK